MGPTSYYLFLNHNSQPLFGLATPQNGLEQFYNLTDALAIASWLNVFIRQSSIVEIACLAQSVNVISPIITSPTSFFRQTTFYPLRLFSDFMRDGLAISTHISNGPVFTGETLPTWIGTVRGEPAVLDVSAVLVGKSLRVAVVNRSRDTAYDVGLRIAFESAKAMQVHEVWHEDVLARNGWGDEENVGVVSSKERWTGHHVFREHSFTLLVIELE